MTFEQEKCKTYINHLRTLGVDLLLLYVNDTVVIKFHDGSEKTFDTIESTNIWLENFYSLKSIHPQPTPPDDIRTIQQKDEEPDLMYGALYIGFILTILFIIAKYV